MTFEEKLAKVAQEPAGVWFGPDAGANLKGAVVVEPGFGGGGIRGMGATPDAALEDYLARRRESLLATAAQRDQDALKHLREAARLRDMAQTG
jgi:delta 1-pyrroline-5-carboxylate dehydrogenase